MTDTNRLVELLRATSESAIATLATSVARRDAGERDGQYAIDLIVDGPLVECLLDAGLGVISEEAGVIEPDRSLVAVVDPVDGSTNASRDIPWFATSVCVFDDDGPLVALVENHATRERFEAVRHQGATRNGRALDRPRSGALESGVVGINGVPPPDGPWAQFRTFGASALDICYVAWGALDAYVDFDSEAHGVWDYAGALLVCQELGVHIEDAFGRALVHREHEARRTPVVAADRDNFETLLALRQRAGQAD